MKLRRGSYALGRLVRPSYWNSAGKTRWRPPNPRPCTRRGRQADPLAKRLVQLDAYLARLPLPTGLLGIFDRRTAANKVPWAERPRWGTALTATGRAVRVLRVLRL